MRTFIRLQDGESAGDSAAGGTAAPTISAANQPTDSNKQVWGAQEPPDWLKASKLEKAHVKLEEPKTETPETTTVQPATPATQTAVSPTPTVQPAAAPAAAAPVADMQSFAKALADAIRQGNAPAQAGGPAPALTDQQIREQLGIFEATVDDYEAAFGVKPTPQQLAAYNKHIQRGSQQAVTIAQVLMQRVAEQARAEFAPVMQTVRSQEAVRQRETFFTENTDLKGYEPLVAKEFQAVMASGRKFPDVNAARKFVADQVRDTLKSIGITPAAPATSSGPASTPAASVPQTATRKMTTTSVGGRSGGSGNGQGQKPSSVEAVWGKKP